MIVVVYLAAFVAAFNENIVNTALVDIMAEFSVDAVMAQWLVSGYMAVSVIMVTIAAFLIKRFPFKGLFVVSAAVMAVGSAGCMLAPNFAVLLVARLACCVGAGVFIPAMMSAAIVLAPEGKTASYLAVGNAMATIGPAVAPALSGMVVTMLGWRFVFAIPLALIVIVLVVSLFTLHDIGPRENLKLDAASLALAAAGLTLFVYGLGQVTAMPLAGCVATAAGVALLAIFVVRQERIASPLLDMSPIHVRGFIPACLLVFCSMMVAFSSSVLLPLYYEMSAGLSAFLSGGLILLPVVSNAVVAVFAGRIMDRHGAWPLLPAGYLVMSLGVCMLAASAALGVVPLVVVGSVVAFSGVGLTFAPAMSVGLGYLDTSINAYGVSIMQAITQAATCIGPSLFVGVMSATAQQLLLGSGDAAAQAAGFSVAMVIAAAISVAGFIGAFRRVRPRCS